MFMKLPERALKDNLAICGLDEAGRGPLAGPVYAACVYIPENTRTLPFWEKVTDSKKLTAKKREVLFHQIKQHSIYGIAFATVEEIDQINILQASLRSMERAYLEMKKSYPQQNFFALIDGNQNPKNMDCPFKTVVKGDSKHLEIAAASILAKVSRDIVMNDLHNQFPHYGWNTNSGYGSAKHLQALQEFGATPHHRTSFAPVKSVLAA